MFEGLPDSTLENAPSSRVLVAHQASNEDQMRFDESCSSKWMPRNHWWMVGRFDHDERVATRSGFFICQIRVISHQLFFSLHPLFDSQKHKNITRRIHGAGIYANMTGVYWWDPWSTIYSSTMDPMGYVTSSCSQLVWTIHPPSSQHVPSIVPSDSPGAVVAEDSACRLGRWVWAPTSSDYL